MVQLMQTDLVNILKMEFLTRCEINSSYSMRAFSRSLGVDQSLLSKVMRRQRKPSKDFTTKILNKLDPDMAKVKDNASAYMDIDHDYLEVISHWYYFAILEYLKFSPKASIKEISKRFVLTSKTVDTVLTRLQEFRFIEKDEEGCWEILRFDNEWVSTEVTSLAKKSIQKQMTAKSMEAIEKVEFNFRDHSSLTLACSRELVPEIRKKIKAFRRSLDNWVCQQDVIKKDVYQLSIGFFPLTEEKRNE